MPTVSGNWSPEEDAALMEAVRQKVSLARLQVRFKRSKGAIRKRALELGVQITPPQRLPTSERSSV